VLSFRGNQAANDVVVTGIGSVTPLGLHTSATWQALLHGQVAPAVLRPDDIDFWEELGRIPGLRRYGAGLNTGQLSQAFRTCPLLQNLAPDHAAAIVAERGVSIALLALQEALNHAQVQPGCVAPHRIGVFFGSSKGGLRTAESLTPHARSQSDQAPRTSGQQSLSHSNNKHTHTVNELTHYWDECDPGGFRWSELFRTDSATQWMAHLLQAGGPVSCPVAACATGLISVLQGAALIQSGACDLCVTGSADAALRASVLSSFNRLRVTSGHDDPRSACRPFDIDRDGFVIGEGAGVLILESRRHALARGIQPLAQVLGGGWLGDSTGMTQMDATGDVVCQLLRRSTQATGSSPDILSVHGTGTLTNDLAESRGIAHAGFQHLPICYGLKGALGHLLGAAGSVETALLVQGITAGMHPGTANLRTQDPLCQIPIARTPGSASATAVWGKLSLGFGGHVAYGLFAKP
jgi:3-oxoacyl-[acyl-carrier-protein] synthase II